MRTDAANGVDIGKARRIAAALRRERAQAGRSGYDPRRHRALVEQWRACRAALPAAVRERVGRI